jgi:hypothetical protein
MVRNDMKIKFNFKRMVGVVVPLLLGVCGVFLTRTDH